jgi:hypothetical protein
MFNDTSKEKQMPRHTQETKLIGVRKPKSGERKRGAEVVFEREDQSGRAYTILAAKCYESWEQWGEPTEILSDNVDAVERWRHNGLDA